MRKKLLIISFMFASAICVIAGETMVYNMDVALSGWTNGTGTTQTITIEDGDKVEGAGSMQWDYTVNGTESWGGSADLQINLGGTTPTLDLTGATGLKFDYKVLTTLAGTGNLVVKIFINSLGNTEEWDVTISDVLNATAGTWVTKEIPFSSFAIPSWLTTYGGVLKLDSIREIQMQVGVGSGATAAGSILLDNLVAVSPDEPAGGVVYTITRETFGNTAYDTNNPDTSAVGFKNQYDWDKIDAWTSTNGHIESGSDSSVRINNYTVSATQSWPDASGDMGIFLCIPTAYNGSWDTIIYKDIDVKGFKNLQLALGWGKRNASWVAHALDTAGLIVEYKIDGGDWASLDPDTSLLTSPLDINVWAYDVLDIPEIGEVLDLRFSTYFNQLFLDDITVLGNPDGKNDFILENIIVGEVTDAADYTCKLNMTYDSDSVYLAFEITDDSLVNTGTEYQIDNLEIYFDMDNSKNVHWPRNGGWMANDPTFDTNDYQIRLVPDTTWLEAHPIKGGSVNLALNDTGYTFSLNIAWDSLMTNFQDTVGALIGFDVLASDNDLEASDANRNQVTLCSPTDKAFNDPSLWATLQFAAGNTFIVIYDEEVPSDVADFTATVADSSATLTWTASTDNIAVMKYIITSGTKINEEVYAKETDNSLTLKDLDPGKYNVGIIAVDNFGNESAKASLSFTIEEPVVPPPPFVANESTTPLNIYPNPATSELRISGVDVNYVEVFSITGNLINTSEGTVLKVSDLSDGVYVLKVYTTDNVFTTRFVKK